MSTKTLGAVGQGLGRQNSIPTILTIPTVPTIPTPWGCSKLKPVKPATLKLESSRNVESRNMDQMVKHISGNHDHIERRKKKKIFRYIIWQWLMHLQKKNMFLMLYHDMQDLKDIWYLCMTTENPKVDNFNISYKWWSLIYNIDQLILSVKKIIGVNTLLQYWVTLIFCQNRTNRLFVKYFPGLKKK